MTLVSSREGTSTFCVPRVRERNDAVSQTQVQGVKNNGCMEDVKENEGRFGRPRGQKRVFKSCLSAQRSSRGRQLHPSHSPSHFLNGLPHREEVKISVQCSNADAETAAPATLRVFYTPPDFEYLEGQYSVGSVPERRWIPGPAIHEFHGVLVSRGQTANGPAEAHPPATQAVSAGV